MNNQNKKRSPLDGALRNCVWRLWLGVPLVTGGLFFQALPAHASDGGRGDVYGFLAGEVASIRYSYDGTQETYPLITLKGGFGRRLTNNWAVEFELHSKSGAEKVSEGICTIYPSGLLVACTKRDAIERGYSLVVAPTYTTEAMGVPLFIRAGVAYVPSASSSKIESAYLTSTLRDAKTSDTVVLLNFGIIRKKKHRIGFTMFSPYGNAETGTFNSFGIDYSYLFGTK